MGANFTCPVGSTFVLMSRSETNTRRSPEPLTVPLMRGRGNMVMPSALSEPVSKVVSSNVMPAVDKAAESAYGAVNMLTSKPTSSIKAKSASSELGSTSANMTSLISGLVVTMVNKAPSNSSLTLPAKSVTVTTGVYSPSSSTAVAAMRQAPASLARPMPMVLPSMLRVIREPASAVPSNTGKVTLVTLSCRKLSLSSAKLAIWSGAATMSKPSASWPTT